MKWMVALSTALAVSWVAAHAGDAHALFVKSSLKKAKTVVKSAAKTVQTTVTSTANKAKDGVKDAAKTVAGAATGAVGAVTGGAKRLFEKAAVGVVNLAKKAKARAADFLKYVQQKGQYLFYQILPGEFRRLQKKLLRANSAGPANGRVTGSAGASAKATTFTFGGDTTELATAEVPASIKKYEAWYNYEAGDVMPAAKVSHKGRQSLVKDQAARGTCVAFATTAAMEAQLSRPKLISQEYVYWLLKNGDKSKICNEAEDGVTMGEAVTALTGKGVPEEVHYLYLPWRGFDFAKMCPAGPTALAKKLANYKAKKIYSFPWNASGKGATISNPRFIEAAIDAGYDLVSSFDIAFMNSNMGVLGGLFYDSTVDPDTGKATEAPGAHAMLIVGYERTGNEAHGGGYIIVKNSWGALWGDGGYVKLSYDYVRQYAGSAFILDGFGK